LPAAPGHVSFTTTLKRNDATPERLLHIHRALIKQALELAWLDIGADRVMGPEFDRERDIVLNGGHRGYLTLMTQGNPSDHSVGVALQHWADRDVPFLGIAAGYWGFYLQTDSLHAEPPGAIPAELASVLCF
jgi:hypothetical protein